MVNTKSLIHIVLITLLSLMSILLVKPIDIDQATHIPVDLIQYREMGQAAPEIKTDAGEPYAYRFLGPWMAGTLFKDLDFGFYFLNILFLLAMALALGDLLLVYGINRIPSLIMVIALLLNRYYFTFIAYDFYQLNDAISIACLWGALSLLKRRHYFYLLPIAIFGILAREILLIWIPVAFFLLYFGNSSKKDWLWIGSISLTLIIFYFGIRLIIPSHAGIGLVQAFADDWNKLIDPWAIGKQLFVANTPLYFLPLIFYRQLLTYVRKYPELLVLLIVTYLTTLFGHDYERLMTPAAPFIFIFVGILTDKLILQKNPGRHLKTGVFILLLFIGSFYHLWGIVLLPDRQSSLIMTFATGMAVGLFFFLLNRNFSGNQ